MTPGQRANIAVAAVCIFLACLCTFYAGSLLHTPTPTVGATHISGSVHCTEDDAIALSPLGPICVHMPEASDK